MAKNRRRPGGGRKPQGNIRGKSAAFTTRITPELRKVMEEEARFSNQSISQLAERILRQGLHERRHGPGMDASVRAVSYLIEKIGNDLICDSNWHLQTRDSEWRTDDFLWHAFEAAVSTVLRALRPSKDKPQPKTIAEGPLRSAAVIEMARENYKSPKKLGTHIAGGVLQRLYRRAASLPDAEKERLGDLWFAKEILTEDFYGMKQACVDLDPAIAHLRNLKAQWEDDRLTAHIDPAEVKRVRQQTEEKLRQVMDWHEGSNWNEGGKS